jgi:hypothetical protein
LKVAEEVVKLALKMDMIAVAEMVPMMVERKEL